MLWYCRLSVGVVSSEGWKRVVEDGVRDPGISSMPVLVSSRKIWSERSNLIAPLG